MTFVLVHVSMCAIADNLPFCDASCELQTLERPLVTSRGCYMSIWNNEDVLGDCWNQPGNSWNLESADVYCAKLMHYILFLDALQYSEARTLLNVNELTSMKIRRMRVRYLLAPIR